jgi:chemotaxis signal transduction protein
MPDNSNLEKFIVFRIGDCLMALPIADVLKVINCPVGDNNGLRSMGLVQLGRHTIRVFDWHEELNSNSLSNLTNRKSFLLIARTSYGELCAIVVDEPPNLVELPLDLMRSIPQSESRSSVFKLVSYAAVVSHNEIATTIFLLDLMRLEDSVDSYPLALKSF